ncbi:carboxymuconolactone decarboxylase family protein [Nordella sp. HKS 07]|uniref:carboxymuconolactone decarboxylase family protein n=1 Tax=Nordella sp. HKS 07 TaxID=2712222 RepID=UPI0013E193A2|nr:carboxymuconolactone decarboxylase family protein [Nordella sp. HKS 07]QIG49384.1 carboxymuconolactone decarboxylase family protein [Nordella sp. HKS 07]
MSIHSCSLGAPILLEETTASGTAPAAEPVGATPACDGVKQIGQWNKAWDPFFNLDPMWADQFMAAGAAIYGSGVFTAKAPGTRRHIKGALASGASVAEIMEVVKLCVAQVIQACNLGVQILAEEPGAT